MSGIADPRPRHRDFDDLGHGKVGRRGGMPLDAGELVEA
jgi:hypothetical protein